VSEAESHIQVGEGVVSRPSAHIRFAGRNAVPAKDDEPAKVRIAVWDESSSEEFNVYLREGETFEIAGQTWRLDKIHEDPRRWCADLTRTA
jgi:Family of unknown function (DUF6406)